MSDERRKQFIDAFLRWPLPETVCADLCATDQNYTDRVGTNLLSGIEAGQLFDDLISPILDPSPQTTQLMVPKAEVERLEDKLQEMQEKFIALNDRYKANFLARTEQIAEDVKAERNRCWGVVVGLWETVSKGPRADIRSPFSDAMKQISDPPGESK